MRDQTLQMLSRAAWVLARSQHGLIARSQLLELGFSAKAIKHRIAKGRLHPVYRAYTPSVAASSHARAIGWPPSSLVAQALA